VLVKKFFKTKDTVKVTFRHDGNGASSAELWCEGAGWEPVTMARSKKGKGPFEVTVDLPVDREFEFRYRLDDGEWQNDDDADGYRSNEFGTDNSVVSTVRPA
jgi:1,4-alpha-glucan branching enzyme